MQWQEEGWGCSWECCLVPWIHHFMQKQWQHDSNLFMQLELWAPEACTWPKHLQSWVQFSQAQSVWLKRSSPPPLPSVFYTSFFLFWPLKVRPLWLKWRLCGQCPMTTSDRGSEFCQFSQFLITLVGLVLLIMLCSARWKWWMNWGLKHHELYV